MPEGAKFELGTKEFKSMEKVGIKELGNVGFILVAGGLGERLGYSGAKVRIYIFDASPCRHQFFICPPFMVGLTALIDCCTLFCS